MKDEVEVGTFLGSRLSIKAKGYAGHDGHAMVLDIFIGGKKVSALRSGYDDSLVFLDGRVEPGRIVEILTPDLDHCPEWLRKAAKAEAETVVGRIVLEAKKLWKTCKAEAEAQERRDDKTENQARKALTRAELRDNRSSFENNARALLKAGRPMEELLDVVRRMQIQIIHET